MSFLKTSKKKSGTYVYEVEGYRDKDGNVKHRYIRAVGKLDKDGNLIPTMKVKDVTVETVKLHGPIQVLHEISDNLGLLDILGDYHAEILTLVYSHILRPESLNNIKKAIQWINTDEIGLESPVSRKRFESAMDRLVPEISRIERDLYEKTKEKCDVTTLFYDITSIYFQGKKVSMARKGYGSLLPHIGIGLAVEGQYGIPVFHHIFPGNVFDAKTFPVILSRLQEFNRKKVTLVYDRGIASKKNILGAVNAGCDVIACTALRGKFKNISVKEADTLGVEHLVKLSSVFIYAKEVKVESPVWGQPLRAIVCLNTALRENIRQRRYQAITEAVERIKKGLPIKEGLKKYITDLTIDYDTVKKSEQSDGLYLMLTNTKYPPEKVVKKYFERDIIEKSFHALKSILSIQPVRHWLTTRIRAHIFICYLAYLHLTWMKMLLRTHDISLSPQKALETLETIYKVKLTDEKASHSVFKTVPLTKEQEKIFKALNLLS